MDDPKLLKFPHQKLLEDVDILCLFNFLRFPVFSMSRVTYSCWYRKQCSTGHHWTGSSKTPSLQCEIKGCGMGTLFVLVSPCFRENVVVTCKIVSFLCSLDDLLQINVIVFFFGNQISKWRSFEKRAILTYFSHFLVTKEKFQKFLQHISHSHTYMYFAHPIDFFALPILKKKTKQNKTNLSGMVSLWYESWCWFLFAPFWNNQWITKWWAK